MRPPSPIRYFEERDLAITGIINLFFKKESKVVVYISFLGGQISGVDQLTVLGFLAQKKTHRGL